MGPSRPLRALLGAAALLLACGERAQTSPRQTGDGPAGEREDAGDADGAPGEALARVLIVSIDGLRPDAITSKAAPRLSAMAATGAYSFTARTVMPSTTVPAHSSMVSGVTPQVHGITWDTLIPDVFLPVPTIFSLATQAGPPAVLVAYKVKLQQLMAPGAGRFVAAPGTDDDVVTQALTEMASPWRVMMVCLPWVDLDGHASGWMSEAYLLAVSKADAAVGRLLDAAPAGTTIIVSADHGGHLFNHTGDAPEDLVIPWLIAGPRVRRGHAIAAPISTMDTAATAAHVLGLTFPTEISGRPVLEAWE